jgi:hypothetical protein
MAILSSNYVHIQGWMYTMGLTKLSEIIAFAIIHGFSQDGESCCSKAYSYISEFLMCDRRTAIRVINSLEEKGLIQKEQYEINNIKFNRYKVPVEVVTKFHHQCQDSVTASDNLSPQINNNNNTNSSNSLIINNNPIPTSPQSPQGVCERNSQEDIFEAFRKIYKGSKRGLKTELENFKKKHKDWREVLPILKETYEKQWAIKEEARNRGCFVPQEKNLSTYLNQRCWEEELNFENNERTYISPSDKARESYQSLARDIAQLDFDLQ